MKKLFFTIAFVFVASFGFASTQIENVVTEKIVNEYGTCTIIITAYNSDGEVVDSRIHTFPADTQSECNTIANNVLTLYQIGTLKM